MAAVVEEEFSEGEAEQDAWYTGFMQWIQASEWPRVAPVAYSLLSMIGHACSHKRQMVSRCIKR